MIKRVLALLFFCQVVLAQSGGGVFSYVRIQPSTLPTACHLGDLRFDVSTSILQFCNASNTWTGYVSGSGGVAGVAHGGTGITSGTSGGILGFTSSSTIASSTALTASQLVIGGGAGATPSSLAAGSQYQSLTMGASNPGYSAVNLAQSAAVSGALGVANGGSGTTTLTAHGVLLGEGTSAVNATSAGTSGQPLLSGGSSADSNWGTLGIAFGGSGQTTANAALNAFLPSQTGSNGFVLSTNGTSTSWISAGGVGTVTSVNASVPTGFSVSGGPITGAGTLAITYSGAAIPVANGGSGTTTLTAHGALIGEGTSAIASAAAGTSGQVFTSGGSSADPAMATVPGNTTILKAPTVQVFTATGSQTGWMFVVSSANATVGATYTNNSNTYTVQATISGGVILYASGTGATSGSTLTKATGTGDSTITFSLKQATATYTTPTSPAPLYLRVRMVGGGSGGGGSGSAAGAGSTGGYTGFANVAAGPGNGLSGGSNLNTYPAGVTQMLVYSGQIGGTSTNLNTTAGGTGAASPLGGGGSGGGLALNAEPGLANTGAGGGGAGGGAATAPASGGGSGAYQEFMYVSSIPATIPYTIGAGGAGGTAGTGGGGTGVGGAGGSGILLVEERYQ